MDFDEKSNNPLKGKYQLMHKISNYKVQHNSLTYLIAYVQGALFWTRFLTLNVHN